MKPTGAFYKDLRELPREKLMALHPNELGLSVRAANVIHNLRVKSIGELVLCTQVDLLKTRTCGRGTLEQIEVALAFCGLRLFGSQFDVPKYIQSPEEWKAEKDHERFVARRNAKRRKTERMNKQWLEGRVHQQHVALLNLKEYLDRKYITMDPQDSAALMGFVTDGLKNG